LFLVALAPAEPPVELALAFALAVMAVALPGAVSWNRGHCREETSARNPRSSNSRFDCISTQERVTISRRHLLTRGTVNPFARLQQDLVAVSHALTSVRQYRGSDAGGASQGITRKGVGAIMRFSKSTKS